MGYIKLFAEKDTFIQDRKTESLCTEQTTEG